MSATNGNNPLTDEEREELLRVAAAIAANAYAPYSNFRVGTAVLERKRLTLA